MRLVWPLLAAVGLCFVDECPPCFNCAAPGMECKHFGECDEFSGRCICPDGFGGEDCQEPVCGSLPKGPKRHLRENGTVCDCDSGWYGINCNMCSENKACNALMPEGEAGTCYTGGILVRENFHYCNVTNRKIKDLLKDQVAHVTFGCDRNESSCDLQFWIDDLESFFCKFESCDFDQGTGNSTEYNCEKISCECVPDRLLCGAKGSIDISEWLVKSVKGPGDLDCDGDGKCVFQEPAMDQLIKFVMGDASIQLQCDASECLHYSEIPGYEPPKQEINKLFAITALIFVVVVLLGSAWGVHRLFYRDDKIVKLPVDTHSLVNTVPISLQFEDIGYKVGEKQILSGISGVASPGQVLAIMGGSGAGKTTLLDILAAKNKSGSVSGSIYCNGVHRYNNKLFGFVDQEDELLPTLTVYETVVTSALLRLPKSMTTEAKKMRALDTMNELGILHLRDSLIGSSGHRGLSGGEKRRVAIACELVTSPSVLLLDEPTSGLDSFNAFNVVEALVNLAKSSNRTVVFTIHQPRSNIVALFDQFLLLAQGQAVFEGTPSQALDHFNSIGHRCPPGYNLADFLIDLTMRARATDSLPCDEAHEAINVDEEVVNPDVYLDDNQPDCLDPSVHQDPTLDDPSRLWQDTEYHQRRQERAREIATDTQHDTWHATHGLKPLFQSFKSSIYYSNIQKAIEEAKEHPSEEHVDAAPKRIGLWAQFVILSSRTFKNLYRNPMLVLTHYSISVALGLFCGLLYFQVAFDISGFQNRLGLFFFLLALFGFSTLTTISLFSQERVIFVRERANGYYNPLAYYMAKVLLDILPLRVVPPILLGFIVYPLVGLNLEDKAPWVFLLTLVLFNLAASTIMLVIGILIPDFGVASLVGCLVNLFGILFAGLFLNQETMPPAFAWMKYVSIFHYAYEALSVNEVRYLSLSEMKFGLQIEVPGATILSAFGFDNEGVPRDILGLGIFATVFLILGYVSTYFWLVEKR